MKPSNATETHAKAKASASFSASASASVGVGASVNAGATAQRALADSALALLAGCVGVAMFLPPLGLATAASLPRGILAGGVIALALPLHWFFLAVGARRMGASVPGWVGLSVALFPVGGAAALILLGGLLDKPDVQPQGAG